MHPQPNPKPSIRKAPFNARMEQMLIERLKADAKRSGISPSEKLRRILDNALPQVA
ncbi:ribbon-helix-helix protein, CopG family [Xanthomonas translucens]|uniref:ribbon-helix-helix protein, CopG family n=1 Tax=Xanthomonas campestris pv. translucens TaxID=343 RepID=UPI00114CCE01|nr:ribbon-helix-helix protein, CopG family [Xanthomonas translucens]